MEQSIEELIVAETKKRLEDMQSETYQFPEAANKLDYIGIIAIILICITLIALCMVGVIQ